MLIAPISNSTFPTENVFGTIPTTRERNPLFVLSRDVRTFTGGGRGAPASPIRLFVERPITRPRIDARVLPITRPAQRVIPRVRAAQAQRLDFSQVTEPRRRRVVRAEPISFTTGVTPLRFGDITEEPIRPRRRRRRDRRGIRPRFAASVLGVLTGETRLRAPRRPLTGVEVRGVVTGRPRRRRRRRRGGR